MAWDQSPGGAPRMSAPVRSSPQWFPLASPVPIAVGRPVFATLGLRTTGLSPREHRVREIAVVRLDERGGVVDELSTTLDVEGSSAGRPGQGGQRFHDIAPALRDTLARTALVAHHAPLATQFLRTEFARAGWDVPTLAHVGTFEASLYYLPGMRRRALVDCCRAAGVPFVDVRSAIGEARATAGLLGAYLDGRFPVPVLDDLVHVPVRAWVVAWPDAPVRPAAPPAAPSEGAGDAVASWPPTARLVRRLSRLDLTALPDARAPHLRSYLEQVVHALETGQITRAGSLASGEVAAAHHVTSDEAAAVHRNLVTELARSAIEDDEYSQDERQDLYQVAAVLGVPQGVVLGLIRQATPVDFPKLEEEGSQRPAEPRGAGPKQIRAWAAVQGYQIEPHERIPWSVVRAFEEAQAAGR